MGLLPEDINHLTEVEEELKKRFSKEEFNKTRRPSNASEPRSSERIDQLVLPDEMRAKMPMTKDKYIVKENPHLVQWEREVRKFLRNLSPLHSHRVSSAMVYEWATGIKVADISQKQVIDDNNRKQNWRTDLRKITKCLTYYFGKPYMTHICGKKVPKAFIVPQGYYITRHRPMTLTLWAEYTEGVLRP